MYRYCKRVVDVGTANYIYFWKSGESITAPTIGDYKPNRQLSYFGTKTRVEFRGSCLKQDEIIFNHKKVVNIYILYELDKLYVKTNPVLVNCLFGAVCLTKNIDIDKYKYSGYGIGFDRRGAYLLPSGNFGRNVIISSVRVDNKGREVLILGKGPTQGLGEHSLTAEKMYSVNFADHREKYCLSLHYNGTNSYLFVNGTDISKFKAKDSETVATLLWLGNISKDWSIDKMKDTGLNGYVYDFGVDYDAIAVDDIFDIHKYLTKKNNMMQKC